VVEAAFLGWIDPVVVQPWPDPHSIHQKGRLVDLGLQVTDLAGLVTNCDPGFQNQTKAANVRRSLNPVAVTPVPHPESSDCGLGSVAEPRP